MKQTRRRFLKLTGTVALAGAALPMPYVMAEEPRTLTISTWGGDTEDAIKKLVQPKFEKEHKVKLVYDIGGMGPRYNKILAQQGLSTVDVFFSTDEPVFNGMRRGLFAELDPKNVPYLKDVYDWATPTKGYGVDYGLITYGLAYHTELVKAPPAEWTDMWRDDLRDKVALPAVAHSMMPALLIRIAEWAGGSINNIKPGLAKLAELRPKKLTFFWTDWAPLMKSGDIMIATEFDYYVEGMKKKGYPVEWVNPRDKGFASHEHLSVLKSSKNKELAEAFVNAMLEPNVQRAMAETMFQGPTNRHVKIEGRLAEKITYGDRLEKIRFFDGRLIDSHRPAWSELLNTQVLPHWS